VSPSNKIHQVLSSLYVSICHWILELLTGCVHPTPCDMGAGVRHEMRQWWWCAGAVGVEAGDDCCLVASSPAPAWCQVSLRSATTLVIVDRSSVRGAAMDWTCHISCTSAAALGLVRRRSSRSRLAFTCSRIQPPTAPSGRHLGASVQRLPPRHCQDGGGPVVHLQECRCHLADPG
jgi:hypothetical protein